MKYLLTDRAKALGKPGDTVELTNSQAAYGKLRGYFVIPRDDLSASRAAGNDVAPQSKPRKRRGRKA